MKTIIAATDFSDSANNAVQFAAAMAAHTGARLVLFNSFQLSLHAANSLVSAAGVDEMFQANKNHLQAQADDLTFRFRITTDIYTKNAYIEDALPEAVIKEQADLVVLGMHQNDWGDRLFGNTTISIIRNATYPVLIVPEKITYKGISKILFAYDGKSVAAENKLCLLKDVARSYGAEVEVFHVEIAGVPAMEKKQWPDTHVKVEAALAGVAHLYKDVAGRSIAESIALELMSYGADMLAVVPHKAGLWNHIAKKSITRKLALEVPVPLLVLPNQYIVGEPAVE